MTASQRLKLILVVVLGLLTATVGQTTALAERCDFGVSALAAKTTGQLALPTIRQAEGGLMVGRSADLGDLTKTADRGLTISDY